MSREKKNPAKKTTPKPPEKPEEKEQQKQPEEKTGTTDPNIAGMGAFDIRMKINIELYHGTDGFIDKISGISDLSRALHPRNLAKAQKELNQMLQLHFVSPYQNLIREIVTTEQEKHGKQVTEPKGSHLLEQWTGDEKAGDELDVEEEEESDGWPSTE